MATLSTRLRYAAARWLSKGAMQGAMPAWVQHNFMLPTFQNLTREGYQKNAAFFACVSTHSFAFPEPPLYVYDDDTDDATRLTKHPLATLLGNPNPLMGEDRLQLYAILYMAVGGVCYLHKVRAGAPGNTTGRVVELWPYHAGQMRAVAGGPTWIDHYEFDYAGGSPQPIARENIIPLFWPSIDPSNPWNPQPPLAAAAREVDTDNEANRYVFAVLKNDATPRTMLELPMDAALSEAEYRRLKAQFADRYGGDMRGNVAILEGGAKLTRASLNMEELAFEALRKIPEARICAVMRVPPILAGLSVGLDNATYSNYEQARKAYTEDTLVPLWRSVSGQIQRDLVPDFGGSVVVRHDLRQVAALADDLTARWTRVLSAVAGGVMTRDEGRRAIGLVAEAPAPADAAKSATPSAPILGYHIDSGVVSRNEARAQLNLPPEDPTLDDQLRKLQAALTVAGLAVGVGYSTSDALALVQLPPATTPPAALPAPPEAPKQLGTVATKASAASLAATLTRQRATHERALAAALDSAFAELADRVVARATKQARRKAADLEALITDGDMLSLATPIKDYILDVLRGSWATWNGVLSLDTAFALTDPAVVAALDGSATRVTGIGETTRAALAAALANGAADGLTGGALSRAIRGVVTESYAGRATTIARTELAMAQQQCATARYTAAGVSHVIVYDGGSEDSDADCDALNGTRQTLAWAEANLLGHPNCVRCFAPSMEE